MNEQFTERLDFLRTSGSMISPIVNYAVEEVEVGENRGKDSFTNHHRSFGYI